MKNAVVLAFDANYLKPASATLHSLAEFNSGQRVIVLGHQLNAKQKLWIRNVNPRLDVEVRDVQADLSGFRKGWLSPAAYARLYIGDICSDIDRAVYLDTDLLVRGSLDPLFSADLDGAPVGMVQDPIFFDFKTRHSLQAAKPKLADFYTDPSHGDSLYGNTGEVTIDILRWNQLGVKDQCLDLMKADDHAHPLVYFYDQDALNLVLRDQWHVLDPIWNLPPSGFFDQPMFQEGFTRGRRPPSNWEQLQRDVRITHFMGDKPWAPQYPDGPDRELWQRYFGPEPGLLLPGINAPELPVPR